MERDFLLMSLCLFRIRSGVGLAFVRLYMLWKIIGMILVNLSGLSSFVYCAFLKMVRSYNFFGRVFWLYLFLLNLLFFWIIASQLFGGFYWFLAVFTGFYWLLLAFTGC